MKQPWQVDIDAVLLAHRTGILKYGPAKKGRPRNGDSRGWGIRETAKDLGIPVGKACENLCIALAMIIRPEIRECSSRDEALRLSRKKDPN
jgi:hypothetical protein